MGSHVIDSALLKDMFGTEEMRRIFSDENLLQKWLDVEAALAKAEAQLGVIPRYAADEITRKAHIRYLDIAEIKKGIDITHHYIVPTIRALQAVCEGDAGEYIHWGATTQDIMDTGFVLQLKEAYEVIFRDLRQVEAILLELTERHKGTIMAGRTHGQHALPITLGYKMAVWLREIRRHLQRLQECRPRLLVGQLAGAVGTMASFGGQAYAIQELTMRQLGLGVPDICWHTARDRLAEFLILVAMVAATLAKIANEVYELQKTEFTELEEPFTPGRVGSSTMPHKRNPFLCESVVVHARIIRYNAALMLEALVGEHERDSRGWKTEWVSVPESCVMLGAALRRTKLILQGLTVRPQRMRENLDLLHGLLLSEAVMLALGQKVGRQSAHDIVYEDSMAAYEHARPLMEVLLQDQRVTAHLSPAQIDRLLDPESYIGFAPQIAQRAVELTRQEREKDQLP